MIRPSFLLAGGVVLVIGLVFFSLAMLGLFVFHLYSLILLSVGVSAIVFSLVFFRKAFPTQEMLQEEAEWKDVLEDGAWSCSHCRKRNLKEDKDCYSCQRPRAW